MSMPSAVFDPDNDAFFGRRASVEVLYAGKAGGVVARVEVLDGAAEGRLVEECVYIAESRLTDRLRYHEGHSIEVVVPRPPPERADPPPASAPRKGGSAPAKAQVRGVPPQKGADPPFRAAPPPHPLKGGQGGAVDGTTTVYRHFDVGGVLLYIGVSNDFERRNDEHLRQKPWAWEIASTVYEHLPTRPAALERERELIKRLHPLHNVQHNQ